MRGNNLPSGRGGPLRRVNRDLDPSIRDCRSVDTAHRSTIVLLIVRINRRWNVSNRIFRRSTRHVGRWTNFFRWFEERIVKDNLPINVHFFLPRRRKERGGRGKRGVGRDPKFVQAIPVEKLTLPNRTATEEWKRCTSRRVYLVCN